MRSHHHVTSPSSAVTGHRGLVQLTQHQPAVMFILVGWMSQQSLASGGGCTLGELLGSRNEAPPSPQTPPGAFVVAQHQPQVGEKEALQRWARPGMPPSTRKAPVPTGMNPGSFIQGSLTSPAHPRVSSSAWEVVPSPTEARLLNQGDKPPCAVPVQTSQATCRAPRSRQRQRRERGKAFGMPQLQVSYPQSPKKPQLITRKKGFHQD